MQWDSERIDNVDASERNSQCQRSDNHSEEKHFYHTKKRQESHKYDGEKVEDGGACMRRGDMWNENTSQAERWNHKAPHRIYDRLSECPPKAARTLRRSSASGVSCP